MRPVTTLTICAVLALVATGCSSGSNSSNGDQGSAAAADMPRLSIAPGGGTDKAPNQGITVTAVNGRIGKVTVRTRGDHVRGKLNAAHTQWHSHWALNVSRRYAVTATAVGKSGRRVTRTSSFRTFTPKKTFTTKLIEGSGQTYGVGMPIILYFDRPISNRAAVERALEIKTSRRVVGAWYWDSQCGTAPLCAYFRPRHYWKPHTRVSFTGHLDGVEGAPGVFGRHTLTQKFTIGSSLIAKASTASHHIDIYRNGKHFARWPISTGKPGDDTPNGTYLTIEKSNPADMVGPGYNIEVPWSVRITWSGDYLHAAPWSVGSQGFANVSHGCVNMSPADAEIYYKMSNPGDPVTISGSPRAGTWDNGWTMWFMPWRRWVRGSALHKAVRAGPHGSKFVRLGHSHHHRRRHHRRRARR